VGLIAHTCVEATVRYAAELGYEVTMVKDATTSYSEEHMHAALDLNIPNYASAMVTTEEIGERALFSQRLISRHDRAAQLQPIRLHSNSEGENYSGFDADSRRRDARLIFRFNRRPDSQAGRRGFDSRLPLLANQSVVGRPFFLYSVCTPNREISSNSNRSTICFRRATPDCV
jgi:Isochorismatase family